MRSVRALAVLVVLAVSGCGGGERSSPPAPRLPNRVSASLARDSRALASTLARGDACAAASQAALLRAHAESAVAAGQVPRAFRRPLLDAVGDLAARVPPCPPPRTDRDEDEDQGKGKERGKKKGHGKGRKDLD